MDTFGEVLKLHRQASLQAEGATTGTGSKVSGSKAGSAELYFRSGDLPLAVELERSFHRYLTYWTERVKAEAEGNRSDVRSAQTRAILGEVGMDATTVAFIYGSTTEAVKKLRGRNGRDPDTGQPKRAQRQERVDGKPTNRAPLTAPPGAVLAGLEALAGETPDQ